MDILNFISWIKGGRQVTTVNAAKTLIPVGLKDDRRDDGYLAGAISVEDLAANLSGDRLVAGSRVAVLDTTGQLTFNSGDATIQTKGSNSDLYISTVLSDDIFINSGDRIYLTCGDGTYDQGEEGGDLRLQSGKGSDGNTNDAGDGGDIRILAGDAGTSTSGNNNVGGDVIVSAGYTTDNINIGGSVYINAGNSNMNGSGYIVLGDSSSNPWIFIESYNAVKFPVVPFNNLPAPGVTVGAGSLVGGRAFISDSTVPVVGNFGAVVSVGGGSFVVPVFSDGADWRIG